MEEGLHHSLMVVLTKWCKNTSMNRLDVLVAQDLGTLLHA